MSSLSLSDLRRLWFGGGASEEYQFLLDASAAGVNARTLLKFRGTTTTGAPTTGTYSKGDFVVTEDGAVWVNTIAGTPGTWTQVAGGGGAPLNPAPVVVAGTADTLAVGDNGKTNRYTDAALVTVTIPTDAVEDLVDGFWTVLYAEGAGGVTLSITGITLTGAAPKKTIAQNEAMMVMKTTTANTWMVMGATAA